MNTIKNAIEEGFKTFDEKFHHHDNCFSDTSDLASCDCKRDDIKSHLRTTISNILSAVETEVEGMRTDKFEEKHYSSKNMEDGSLLEVSKTGGHICNSNCIRRPKEYFDTALTDIQALLKSAK